MKRAATFKFKSEVKAWVNGGVLDFQRFVQPRGPRGGRVVIDRLVLHSILTLTVATQTTEGEDLYRAFQKVTVEEKDGTKRFNEITGDALRIIGFAHNEPGSTHEHADFAAGGPTARTMTAVLPLTKPYAYEPDDYGMPAELFEKVSITCASNANMSLGTSVVTIASGTYWVIAECHEEFGVVQYISDEWLVRPMASASATEQELITSRGRLQDLYLWIPGQGGGQTLANLSEIFVEHMMPRSLLKDPDLTTAFERERNICPNLASTPGTAISSSPFTGSTLRAVAALLATGTKTFEGPERTQHQVRLTLSAALPAAPSIIARVVYPRNPRVTAELAARYGKSIGYLKTADRTKRNPAEWKPEHAPYIPFKFA